MLRTKFVFTLGPSSSDRDTLFKLIDIGMNVARINMSHIYKDTYHKVAELIQLIRELSDETGRPIAIMADLQGPKIRIGKMQPGGVHIEQGEALILTTDKVVGVPGRIPVQYANLPNLVNPGETIYLDDGLLALEVLGARGNDIRTRVVNGGHLDDYKGMNFPDTNLDVDSLTIKDRRDLVFVLQQEVDWIALSFVRTAKDILILKELITRLSTSKYRPPVIAKIEKPEAVDNIDSIIDVSDGIMVARGDLGVEIGTAKVPVIQKLIIERCHNASKPVITATQMLDSMIRNPMPTRAEASDVANAVFDGTDAVMLSGETANGRHVLKAAETMRAIVLETESTVTMLDLANRYKPPRAMDARQVMARTVADTAGQIGAKAIIAPTISGATAKMIAGFHPLTSIIAVTPIPSVQRELCLYKGIIPIQADYAETVDEVLLNSILAAKQSGYVYRGDLVVLTSGMVCDLQGTTNSLTIHRVECEYSKDKSSAISRQQTSRPSNIEIYMQPTDDAVA